MSGQISNGRALGIILRREIIPVSVGLLVFLGFPHVPRSPMACLLSHHPVCTAHQRDFVQVAAYLVVFLVILTAGLPTARGTPQPIWPVDERPMKNVPRA